MSQLRDDIKLEILRIFNSNVKGRKPDLSGYRDEHDGAEGHWLTLQMGLAIDNKNEPDFKGFEMKKDSDKTTFGDWSPDIALFKKNESLSRDKFLRIFGHLSPDQSGHRAGRHSWSGKVFPTIKGVNQSGQILKVDSYKNVIAEYHYSLDKRENKESLVPKNLQKDDLILAKWTNSKLQTRVENKFNNFGWFKCLKDSNGFYQEIQFGHPIDFPKFIDLVKSGDIFVDCGMYSSNPRPYMQWRASKEIWNKLAETDSL